MGLVRERGTCFQTLQLKETTRGLSGLVSRLEDAELACITGGPQPEHGSETDLGSQITHCELWRLRSGGSGWGKGQLSMHSADGASIHN